MLFLVNIRVLYHRGWDFREGYVEEAYRNQGIAGKLLEVVCDDCLEKGIETLYLITGHTSFYERYGWEFLCMVQGEGEPEMSRMYIHNGNTRAAK